MTTLFAADIHLSSEPMDAYRFGLFPWLAEQARDYAVDQVIILGDLTKRKDRHPARLVSGLVNGIGEVADVCTVIIIPGNHDASDPACPFFQFLAGFPNVLFMVEPTFMDLQIRTDLEPCWFLPATPDPANDWKDLGLADAKYIFMHQPVIGAAMENGMKVERGLPYSFFQGIDATILSGDIHTPQRIGKRPCVEYVGAPYRVDFGDHYKPRCLLVAPEGREDLRFPCVNKHVIDINGDGEINLPEEIVAGDQVKVRVTLERHELVNWSRIRAAVRAWAVQGGYTLFGPTLILASDRAAAPAPMRERTMKRNPSDIVNAWAATKGLEAELAQIAHVIIGENHG